MEGTSWACERHTGAHVKGLLGCIRIGVFILRAFRSHWYAYSRDQICVLRLSLKIDLLMQKHSHADKCNLMGS